MYSLTVDEDTFSNKEEVAVTSVEVEVTGSEAILALSFSTLLFNVSLKVSTRVCRILGGCLLESVSTDLCSSLLEDDAAIFSVKIGI